MSRPAAEILTEREAQIMDVLWRAGNVTADEVRAALPDQPHDSTVRTLLRILETKGYVAHSARGKSYVYRAKVARAQAQKSAARQFLARLFGGSAESLVLRLIEDEALTPEQLEAIRKTLRKGSESSRPSEFVSDSDLPLGATPVVQPPARRRKGASS